MGMQWSAVVFLFKNSNDYFLKERSKWIQVSLLHQQNTQCYTQHNNCNNVIQKDEKKAVLIFEWPLHLNGLPVKWHW